MSEPMVTLPASVLSETIESLERAGCQFLACQGPDAPFEDMVTCIVCASIQTLRNALTTTQEATPMAETGTENPVLRRSTIVEQDFYFVIQRSHITAVGKREWVDSSGKYYGEAGGLAAMPERDRMREIFGEDAVKIVRRDVLVTETPVEDSQAAGEAGEQGAVKALRACIAALRKIDMANCALTEGRGDLLYDNPDPIAREMSAALGEGQRIYLEASRVLRGSGQ